MKNGQKGLSLVEMIIAIAIMALFLGITGTLIAQSIKLYSKQSLTVSLEDQLRSVQDVMIRDLRPCNWVATTSTSPKRLYFSTTGTNFNQYYEWNGTVNTLYRKLNNGNNDPIADNITNASFRVNSITPSTFQVDVELTAALRDVTKTTSFSVNLRNYK